MSERERGEQRERGSKGEATEIKESLAPNPQQTVRVNSQSGYCGETKAHFLGEGISSGLLQPGQRCRK